jgi:hypothetical protein
VVVVDVKDRVRGIQRWVRGGSVGGTGLDRSFRARVVMVDFRGVRVSDI